jgi:hypothetical protein
MRAAELTSDPQSVNRLKTDVERENGNDAFPLKPGPSDTSEKQRRNRHMNVVHGLWFGVPLNPSLRLATWAEKKERLGTSHSIDLLTQTIA